MAGIVMMMAVLIFQAVALLAAVWLILDTRKINQQIDVTHERTRLTHERIDAAHERTRLAYERVAKAAAKMEAR